MEYKVASIKPSIIGIFLEFGGSRIRSKSIRMALCTDESLDSRGMEDLAREEKRVASGSGVLNRVIWSFYVEGDGKGDATTAVGRTSSMTGLVSSWGPDSVEDAIGE